MTEIEGGQGRLLANLEPDVAGPGTELEIEILGDRRPATVVESSPWDPENARLRA